MVVKLGMSRGLGTRLDEGQRSDRTGTHGAGRAYITFTISHQIAKKYLQGKRGLQHSPSPTLLSTEAATEARRPADPPNDTQLVSAKAAARSPPGVSNLLVSLGHTGRRVVVATH